MLGFEIFFPQTKALHFVVKAPGMDSGDVGRLVDPTLCF
jgi:hypothetical protein